MIKVLHICSGYYNNIYKELFTRIKERGIEQFIYFPKRKWMKDPDFESSDLKGYSFSYYSIFFKIFYFLKIKVYSSALFKYFENNNVDYTLFSFSLSHAHNLFVDGAIAYKLKKRYGLKYITAIRNADFIYLRKMPFLHKFGEKILSNSEKIICISHSLKKKTIKTFKNIENIEKKVIVVPNGISKDYLNSIPQKKETPKNKIIKLIYVGYFFKSKNIDKLIQFVENYKDQYILNLIGGNYNEKKILKMIKTSSNVNYLGLISDKKEIINYYRQSDIFIMLSINETFGLVYPEAMSQGLPIIYSKNTGFDGFYKDGEIGFSMNPEDTHLLPDIINKIINNYDKISESCITHAKEFDWDKIALKYISIYKNILN